MAQENKEARWAGPGRGCRGGGGGEGGVAAEAPHADTQTHGEGERKDSQSLRGQRWERGGGQSMHPSQ